MKNICLLLALGCLFFGCEENVPDEPKIEESDFTVYTISAGAHNADKNTYKSINFETLDFDVVFDSSAIYTTQDPGNQADINKLYGFADGGSFHQQHSARIGWRWYNNELQLLSYTYANSVRSFEYLGAIVIGDTINCKIQVVDSNYVFHISKVGVKIYDHVAARGVGTSTAVGYKLYPYFGGDETAPKEIKISIREN